MHGIASLPAEKAAGSELSKPPINVVEGVVTMMALLKNMASNVHRGCLDVLKS